MSLRLDAIKVRQRELETELARLRSEVHRIEIGRFVGVQFHGNATIYTYELAPGHRAEVGDFVCVYSPRTHRNELVRVVRKGRGEWRYATKIARRIHWTVDSDDGQCDEYGGY